MCGAVSPTVGKIPQILAAGGRGRMSGLAMLQGGIWGGPRGPGPCGSDPAGSRGLELLCSGADGRPTPGLAGRIQHCPATVGELRWPSKPHRRARHASKRDREPGAGACVEHFAGSAGLLRFLRTAFRGHCGEPHTGKRANADPLGTECGECYRS